MSNRLQVLFSPDEYRKLKQHAKRARMTLGEWVRSALRRVTESDSARSPDEKLRAVRKALTFGAPVGTLKEMEDEIERSYLK